ncbi:hypothetical protein GCM10010306_095860 [Streptomyces umbrinus]|nr:hypothetical protein GCM10010306_095860 [Streptomyces umbrinus]
MEEETWHEVGDVGLVSPACQTSDGPPLLYSTIIPNGSYCYLFGSERPCFNGVTSTYCAVA